MAVLFSNSFYLAGIIVVAVKILLQKHIKKCHLEYGQKWTISSVSEK